MVRETIHDPYFSTHSVLGTGVSRVSTCIFYIVTLIDIATNPFCVPPTPIFLYLRD